VSGRKGVLYLPARIWVHEPFVILERVLRSACRSPDVLPTTVPPIMAPSLLDSQALLSFDWVPVMPRYQGSIGFFRDSREAREVFGEEAGRSHAHGTRESDEVDTRGKGHMIDGGVSLRTMTGMFSNSSDTRP